VHYNLGVSGFTGRMREWVRIHKGGRGVSMERSNDALYQRVWLKGGNNLTSVKVRAIRVAEEEGLISSKSINHLIRRLGKRRPIACQGKEI